MTNNVTTCGESIKPIFTCPYCQLNTAGNHAFNYPLKPDFVEPIIIYSIIEDKNIKKDLLL